MLKIVSPSLSYRVHKTSSSTDPLKVIVTLELSEAVLTVTIFALSTFSILDFSSFFANVSLLFPWDCLFFFLETCVEFCCWTCCLGICWLLEFALCCFCCWFCFWFLFWFLPFFFSFFNNSSYFRLSISCFLRSSSSILFLSASSSSFLILSSSS